MKKEFLAGLAALLTYGFAGAIEPIKVTRTYIPTASQSENAVPIGPGPLPSIYNNNCSDPVANAIANDPKLFFPELRSEKEKIKKAKPVVREVKQPVNFIQEQTPVVKKQKLTIRKQKSVYQPRQVQQVQIPAQDYSMGVLSKLEKQLIRQEGYKHSLYYDKYGEPHVGIGFYLKRKEARKRLAEVGANLDEVMKGKPINDKQIMTLFRKDLTQSIYDAKRIVGEKQPQEVIDIVANMVYNMGANRFDDFKRTIDYIKSGNYSSAADRMKASDWYNQVGSRARELTNEMRSLSAKYPVKKGQVASSRNYRRGR